MSLIVKIILIVVIGLLLIAAILWYLFYTQQQATVIPANINNKTTQTNNQPTLPVLPNQNTATANVTPSATSQADLDKVTLSRMASAFAERFGSYSNQSNYTNFEDLYDFMTVAMKSWSANMVADLRAQAQGNNSIYFGVTTKALSASINNFDSGQAEILVKTQRREATGSTSNARIYYQDIIIKFVKEDGIWKADGAWWQ